MRYSEEVPRLDSRIPRETIPHHVYRSSITENRGMAHYQMFSVDLPAPPLSTARPY